MTSKLKAPQVRAMRTRRATGESLSRLGRAYGVSDKTVAYHCRDIPPPPRGWENGGLPPKTDTPEMEALRAMGMAYKDIGARYGISGPAVFQRIQRFRRRRIREARQQRRAA